MRRPVRHAFVGIIAVAMQLVIASSAAAAPAFVNFAENTSPQYQHASGSTMWINPLFSGGFTVLAEEHLTDTSLVFPSLGAGWIGGGSVVPTGATETMNYDWTPAPTNPGAVLITSNPSLTSVGFTVAADSMPAAGGSILYPGATNAPTATVTFATGSDADSGIAASQLQRRVAPLMGDICSGYGAFANIGPASPAGPTYSDATVVSGNCYQYRLVVTDNVGNDAIFSSAVDLKVDTTLPSGTIDAMPVSPFTGPVTLTGSSSDAHTSVTSIAVTYAGASSGTACSGLTGASWSCSWDTTVLPDGTYSLTATFTDAAGNTSTATRSVVIDTNAPVTSVSAITEVTGQNFQHVDGTNLYFNPAQAGSATIEVDAVDSGTGVQSVSFPDVDGASTEWTPAGLVDTSAFPYAVTYAWTSGAANPGLQVAVATDSALNSANATFQITADTAAPISGSVGYTDGYIATTSTSVTLSPGADAASGVSTWQLQRASAPLVAGTCGGYGSFANIGAADPAGPYVDSSLADATCYKYRLVVTDRVGNVATFTSASVLKVATASLTASFVSWTQTTNAQFQHAVGSTLFFNPAQSGTATIEVAATDAVSGIASIAFPDLDGAGTLWTPAGSTGTAVTQAYAWTSGAAEPAAKVVTVTNNASDTAPVPFIVTSDSAAPIGGSLTYPNGYRSIAGVPLTFAPGSDVGSNVASWQLQRRSASLIAATCGAFGAFANVGAASPTSPFSDTTVVDGTCYEYQLLVTDNVGNVATTTSASTTKIDATLPTGTIDAAPVSPFVATVALTGTSADTGSGIANLDVTYSGPASGNICLAAAPPASWSCAWDTTTVADGAYTVTSSFTDAAGNVGTATRSVLVDNGAPMASLDSVSEGAGGQFQHVSGSTLWFNPTASGSFTVRVAATDPGSGIQRVDFPDVDGAATSWTPAGGSDTSAPYEQAYAWVAGAATPGAQQATAFEQGGLSASAGFTVAADGDAPTGGSVTYPETTSGPVSVAFANGSDTASGIASSQLQRRSAALVNGTCATFGAFADLGTANAVSPFSDTTVAAGSCYQYRLVVTDRVSNVASFSSSATLRFAEVALTGTTGGDTITGTESNDEIQAGSGSDTILASAGNDTIDGGPGIDTLALTACKGANVDLARGMLTGCGNGTTKITGIEVVTGSTGSDVITGNTGANRLLGGGGNDAISGGGGNDLVNGGDGNDRLSGGSGADQLLGGKGIDRIGAGSGSDIVVAGAGNDIVRGDAGNDRLDGGLGADRLDGGVGSDRLTGGAGADNLRGGDGRDELHGGVGADVLFGGFGSDRMVGGAGVDRFIGGTGEDTVTN